MANIITTMKERMIDAREGNKAFPCTTYATEANAEKAVAKAALAVGQHFSRDPQAQAADYVVFYIAEWGRWVGAINLSEVIRRPDAIGGYMGVEPNFFKW